jgi:hypothetical protein
MMDDPVPTELSKYIFLSNAEPGVTAMPFYNIKNIQAN